jgi:predicted transposase/invertase (TIGR01784 family)
MCNAQPIFERDMTMPKKYLDPTVDLVFKKLFGDKSHKDVTIDFLNNILGRTKGNLIDHIELNDPFNRKENREDRLSIVDVRCTDQAGKTYIVEMQATAEPDFRQRCEHYVACELSSQLNEKMPYGAVTPVIMVAILGFPLFKKHERHLTHHAITDLYDGVVYLNNMEFHFIELPKFNKTEDQLTNDVDRWIFFFGHAAEYRNNPDKIAKKNKAIATAFEIVDQANWSKKEIAEYNRDVDVRRRTQAKFVDEHEQGLVKGRKEEKNKIARNMLAKKMAVEDIAEITGLPLEALKKLKKT